MVHENIKLTCKFNKESGLFEVIFQDSVIAEFANQTSAEKFMLGQSCTSIIRAALGQQGTTA